MLWFIILCKKYENLCSKITMVEVQTWTPLKNNTMWQHFWPPRSMFSPITTWSNFIAKKHKQEIYHDFDYFLKNMSKRSKRSKSITNLEQEENHPKTWRRKSSCLYWRRLGARGESSQNLKEEELMALLEETIVETKKEVMGRIFFSKVDHITETGEVVGIIYFFPK